MEGAMVCDTASHRFLIYLLSNSPLQRNRYILIIQQNSRWEVSTEPYRIAARTDLVLEDEVQVPRFYLQGEARSIVE